MLIMNWEKHFAIPPFMPTNGSSWQRFDRQQMPSVLWLSSLAGKLSSLAIKELQECGGESAVSSPCFYIMTIRDLHGDRNHTHPHPSLQTLFPSTPIPIHFHFHPRLSPHNFNSIPVPSPSIFIPSPCHPRPRTYSRQQVKHKFWCHERN